MDSTESYWSGGCYEIREATAADVEAIRRMHAQSWRDNYRNDDSGVTEGWLEQETASWMTDERLDNSRQILSRNIKDVTQFYRIALLDDEVVGLMHLSTKPDSSKHFNGLYLAKKTHGTGLAQQLWQLAEGWIGDSDCDLEVVDYNERAKAFYKKCGFEEIGLKKELFKEKMPVMNMIRKRRIKT